MQFEYRSTIRLEDRDGTCEIAHQTVPDDMADPYVAASLRFHRSRRPALFAATEKVALPSEFFHYSPETAYCGSLLPLEQQPRPSMLELRYPPAHRIDEQHLAAVRQIIAEVLQAQRQRGNRAGNQAIIDKIGLDARLVQGEGYWGEALDYHLGLLYAHIGEPEKPPSTSSDPTPIPATAATRFLTAISASRSSCAGIRSWRANAACRRR